MKAKEGGFLPSESQPSSYLVNKDILLGVIPAEQDGLLGVTLLRCSPPLKPLKLPIPKLQGPILSTLCGYLRLDWALPLKMG